MTKLVKSLEFFPHFLHHGASIGGVGNDVIVLSDVIFIELLFELRGCFFSRKTSANSYHSNFHGPALSGMETHRTEPLVMFGGVLISGYREPFPCGKHVLDLGLIHGPYFLCVSPYSPKVVCFLSAFDKLF